MNILITGRGSYVGTNIKKWFELKKDFVVDELDVKTEQFKSYDFSKYDVLIHVAAIVHKASESISEKEYIKVNAQLPFDIARIAKQAGVKQFIFFSSMGVYGEGKALPQGNLITKETPLNAKKGYAGSKLLAEKLLTELSDQKFIVSVVRPPSIYGPNCPGNYIDRFVDLAKWLPVFPHIYNESKQSFIFIDNLCKFIELLIEHPLEGVFHPQDAYPLSSIELIDILAQKRQKSIRFIRFLNPFIRLFEKNNLLIKLFGGVSYSTDLSSHFNNEYQLYEPSQAFEYLTVG